MKQITSHLLWILALIFTMVAQASDELPVSKAMTEKKQSTLTPQRAVEILKEGNKRFLQDKVRSYDYRKEMKVTAKRGQFPVAIVLNCIDSRSIADILFDQGLGNLFVSRVAGNVVDTNILGGMEFATEYAGVPLIIVMGHTHCGAVHGACAGGASGNLKHVLDHIQPAVNTIIHEDNTSKNCNSPAIVDSIAKQNVINQIDLILKNSRAIAKLVKEKKVMVIGAMHNIKTGEVVFFDINEKAL
ncbi:carbonic anhydrase [Legionella nagasakiensis]|uniref:carbonic anhydrase n=1 Tax=Legionella nagasakiensis TaxID=535290 RepID=UPI0010553F85|nr:carbonic anhydrase [Legionella nagasakiensis]